MRTYKELISLPTYEDRLSYLMLHGITGSETFGHLRYLNQRFYNSIPWQSIRDQIIIRDDGCDLACLDRPIIKLELVGTHQRGLSPLYVHHINPITPEQLLRSDPCLLDPNNLVLVSAYTHNMIHYGCSVPTAVVERRPNDTCPWKE